MIPLIGKQIVGSSIVKISQSLDASITFPLIWLHLGKSKVRLQVISVFFKHETEKPQLIKLLGALKFCFLSARDNREAIIVVVVYG